jgi:branched-chain amino acid transport system substrate-binding protein
VRKAGSSDPTAVAKALSGGEFDTPFGRLKVRAEDHQIVMPNYFGPVKELDGKLRSVVEFVLPAEEATPPVDPACHMPAL